MPGERAKITRPAFAFVGTVLLILLYLLRYVLIPFVLAAALAYVLAPAVRVCQRWLRCPRWAAAVVVYMLVAGGLGAAGWRAGSIVYARASHFSGNGQQELNRLLTHLFGAGQMTLFGLHLDAQQIAGQIFSRLQNGLESPDAAKIAGLGASVLVGAVLFVVLLFYFFLHGPELAHGLLNLAPPEHRPAMRAFGARVNPILQRYLRGLWVIVVFASLVVGIGAGLIFHLSHPLLLAMAAGLLELVPILGPTISATLLSGAAVLHGGSLWTLLGFAVFWCCLRLAIDQVLGPLVLGHAVRLHPVAVMFAFIAGGVLFGPLGVLLAIPTVAVLKLLLDNYYALPVEE
jgi:predicted PurR-regulated permease PerM